MKIKKKIKNLLYKHPKAKEKIEHFFSKAPLLRRILNIGFEPTFSGWGLTTFTHTPWGDATDLGSLEIKFNEANDTVIAWVKSDSFKLTQFKPSDRLEMLRILMWRHYIVFWSAAFAARNTNVKKKNIVECGVCDGLTSFFAISALVYHGEAWGAFLYDAWEAMRADLLLDSEKSKQGEYSYLDVELTKANLACFGGDIVFNKGYIPESFSVSNNPENIVWLHLDLNSATPTIAALEYFWERIAPGGVVLFDDYNLPGYEDTRNLVIAWLNGKNGTMFPLPTCQALIFKH